MKMKLMIQAKIKPPDYQTAIFISQLFMTTPR